jgi:hypothetical protein
MCCIAGIGAWMLVVVTCVDCMDVDADVGLGCGADVDAGSMCVWRVVCVDGNLCGSMVAVGGILGGCVMGGVVVVSCCH